MDELKEQLTIVTNELIMQIALRFSATDIVGIRENNPIVRQAIAISEKYENKHDMTNVALNTLKLLVERHDQKMLTSEEWDSAKELLRKGGLYNG